MNTRSAPTAQPRRPKLLFITYTFPPVRRSGSVRTWNIAKYLARSGWEITVVTPDPSRLRYVENPSATTAALHQEGIQRLLTGHSWSWLAADTVDCSNEGLPWLLGGIARRLSRSIGIDRSVGWIKAGLRACSDLRPADVDVILASGPPFSAFPLAQRLSRRLGRPYVLDYRDLWSRDIYDPVPRAAGQESSVLNGSAAVTTVSPSWASILDRDFGVGSKLHVVSNGYDAEYLAKITPHEFGHFAIVYAGTLFPPKRVVSPLMAALRRIREDPAHRSTPWRFHYYGPHVQHVSAEAERFGLQDHVVLHGEVSRLQALSSVKGAGVAVVITSVAEEPTAEDNGMVTGKIFEAVGLRTPTLLIAPSGSDANSVAETSGLARSFTADDVAGIAAFVESVMEGKPLESKDPAAYAWENLVSRLATVLESTIAVPQDRAIAGNA